MDEADGEDGRLLRIDLAADDGLRDEDEFCGENDGVFSDFGARAVAADAADRDVDSCGTGEEWTAFESDGSGSDIVGVVLGNDEIGPAEALIESSASMAFAPSMVSSEGWPMSMTVRAIGFAVGSSRAVPRRTVMWMSCPQACMTPTSWPCALVERTVEA